MFCPAPVLFHPLLGKRFLTIRDEESVPGNSDDVFLAEEEPHSFQQQVAFVKTSRKRNSSYVGVPGVLWRSSLYSSTRWRPQASIAANWIQIGTKSCQQGCSWTGTYFTLLSDQVSYTFEILNDQYSCNQIAEELVNSINAALVCQLLRKGRTAWSIWWGFKPLLKNTWPIF